VALLIEKEDGTIIDTLYYRPEYNYFFDIISFTVFMPEESYIGPDSSHYIPSPEEIANGETEITLLINDKEVTYTKSNEKGDYLDSMLGFPHHKIEPVDPATWNIEITPLRPVNNLISIDVDQIDSSYIISGLYVSSDFILEKYEDGKWIELPVKNGYKATSSNLFYTSLSCDGSPTSVSYYITNKYSRPHDSGLYRITVTIYDGNSKDKKNLASRDYSLEFELN
jgi:hypothetical protein